MGHAGSKGLRRPEGLRSTRSRLKSAPRRRIAVVTGTRAEYGLLKPVMEAIRSSRGLELCTIAAGMHLATEFGSTVEEIRRDGFTVDASVDMLLADDRPAAAAKGFGLGVIGMAQAIESLSPQVVLVLGDRVEAFAAATAAVLSNRVLAHVHGGERTRGGHDESMRHAISKLAHIHFPATQASARRLVRMGEDRRRIFVVGAPGLDVILHERPAGAAELRRVLGVDVTRPFLLVVQHSVSTAPEEGGRQFAATLKALGAFPMPKVVIYPNSDPGNRQIVEAIAAAAARKEVVAVRNLPRRQYLGLVQRAAAMVGNSSSGLLEAASYKTPAVNVGTRQAGRQRGANVIDVGHDPRAIVRAIHRALTDRRFRQRLARTVNPYGDGHASHRIAHVLAHLPLGQEVLQKQITY